MADTGRRLPGIACDLRSPMGQVGGSVGCATHDILADMAEVTQRCTKVTVREIADTVRNVASNMLDRMDGVAGDLADRVGNVAGCMHDAMADRADAVSDGVLDAAGRMRDLVAEMA